MNMPLALRLSAFVSLSLLAACGKKSTGSGIGAPSVEPPVAKATPSGLSTVALFLSTQSVASTMTDFTIIGELQDRFYKTGPTNISNLLKTIDSRLAEINSRAETSTSTCLSNAVVEDTVTIFGESVVGKFQCYDAFSTTGGMMFGKDGTDWYLYTNDGQMRSFVKVSPVSGSTDDYVVDARMSVGQLNGVDSSTQGACGATWYGCSYGVIRLVANSATKSFEMSTAGTGTGFSTVHLKSDGTNLYAKGRDGNLAGGTTWSNVSGLSEICGLASDTATAGDCTTLNESNFTFKTLNADPASDDAWTHTGLGFADVTLDGSATDAVHFGRSAAELSTLAGVTAF